MPKKFSDEPEAPKKLASYTAKLDDALFTFDPKKYPGVEVIDLR